MRSDTQVALAERRNTLRTMLSSEGVLSQVKMALPRHMDAQRLFRVVMTALQRTPQLLDCSPESIVKSFIEAAQLGLEPDGVLGHAYLIPFRNSKTGGTECQLMPGYKGLLDLARRSGAISTVYSHCVHQKDRYQFEYGLHPKLRHTPSADEDPGKVIAVYAVAHMKDGGIQFEWMWRREIESIRKSSRAGNSGPWVTHWDEMARKTVLRRLCKMLPLSVEVQRVVAVDEYVDAGVAIEGTVVESASAADSDNGRQSGLDALADRLAGTPAAGTEPDDRDAGTEPGDGMDGWQEVPLGAAAGEMETSDGPALGRDAPPAATEEGTLFPAMGAEQLETDFADVLSRDLTASEIGRVKKDIAACQDISDAAKKRLKALAESRLDAAIAAAKKG